MTQLINLTPHDIKIIFEDGTTLKVPASGEVARVATSNDTVGGVMTEAGTIPVKAVTYGEVTGLPDYDPDKAQYFLVSSLVAARVPDRRDVLVPGDFVRDEKGNIIGCRSLNRV